MMWCRRPPPLRPPRQLRGAQGFARQLGFRLQKDIDGLPRRVNDEFHNQGDMVNFVLVGSEQQVKDALNAANWQRSRTPTTKKRS